MKRRILILLSILLCLCLCGCLGQVYDNKPYEPDTPAPAPHEGLFTSEHGSLRFDGDGESVELELDEELAARTGLPEGRHSGTYEFLSGNLPPHGSMPIRYDAAHELRLTVGETTVVLDVGVAAKDGKTGQVGINTVTPDRIPLLFHGESGWFDVIFVKEAGEHE